jgi:hypothetical protein
LVVTGVPPDFKLKGRNMKCRILAIIALVVAFGVIAFGAADPFTGAWRQVQVPSNKGNSKPDQLRLIPSSDGFSIKNNSSSKLILSPNSNGITIQASEGGKPNILQYGKDYLSNDGTTWNTVRVTDHMLKSAFTQGGKIIINETATVSPDGKRYTRIRELVGSPRKETLEYNRVGPAPAGDAFFGTWQEIVSETGPLTYRIKVEGDTFEIGADGTPEVFRAKLDGKEHKHPTYEATMQAKRSDAQTIEILFKNSADLASKGPGRPMLWQVKGDTLTLTLSTGGPQSKPINQEFERVK